MYMPTLSAAVHVRSYTLAQYRLKVLTHCKSPGLIQYKYVILVYEQGDEPVMAITSEHNPRLTDGSYFLGVFPGYGHVNLGNSIDWGDLEKFIAKALTILAEYLMINTPPQEAPLDR
ncbi:MAG: hypothetical protein MUF87_14375 [Anaerolineae bacterium]|jgi:hypothetical protein|nr:hypothetical protein [Anaerolineae bacterium]